MIRADALEVRRELLALIAELRACEVCRAGPYCARHPKALLLELLLADRVEEALREL